MIQTAMKTKGAVNHSSLSTINDHKLQRTFSAQNLLSLNQPIVNRPAANQGKPVQPHRPMAANTAGHPQTSSYTGSKNRQPQPAGHPASIIPGTQADAAAGRYRKAKKQHWHRMGRLAVSGPVLAGIHPIRSVM